MVLTFNFLAVIILRLPLLWEEGIPSVGLNRQQPSSEVLALGWPWGPLGTEVRDSLGCE